MGKLISFLIQAFSDKEGNTRFGSAVISTLVISYSLFTLSPTFTDFKAGQDNQNRLLWAAIQQLHNENVVLRNTLDQNHIIIPELTTMPSSVLMESVNKLNIQNEHQTP